MRATQQTALTVRMSAADAAAVLRVGRDDKFTPVALVGTTATVTLSAGDYVITLDQTERLSSSTPVTVSTDVDVLYMSAGLPVNGVRPLIVGPGRQAINDDPKDPWPPPPPPSGITAEAAFLSSLPITSTMKALLDAYVGKGSDDSKGVVIHALLIGIDAYTAGPGAGGAIYRPLRGCVRDILEVEKFLRHDVGIPAERITRLIAPATAGGEQPSSPELVPTYDNIVAAWKRVMATAKSGDIVYIHYSGHGGRSTTLFPGFKANGLDESLAPCDINERSTGRYLRDVEVAVLLKQMEERELLTTLVLDSCHSGSATRGDEAQARRGDTEDRLPRSGESLDNSAVASRSQLEAMAKRLESIARTDEAWRIDPGSAATSLTTVIAACRAHESCYEYAVDGQTRMGVLTHFWLDTLRQRGAALTYRTAYRQVFARVQGVFKNQAPLLLGAANRHVLGTSTLAQPASIAILEVHGDQVMLAAGASGLLQVGTRLAVIPVTFLPELANIPEMTQIEVTAVEAATSRARVVPGTGEGQPITLSSQAVIVTYAPTMRREVRWAPPKAEAPPLSRAELAAKTAVENEIASDTTNAIGLATTDTAHYQLAIDDAKFVILDPMGSPLPYLRPEIGVDTPDAPRIVKARLVHLARFQNVRELVNDDRNSPLAGKLELTLHMSRAGKPEEPPLSNHPILGTNSEFFLKIRNRSTRPLSLAIFDLACDWSIGYVNENAPLTVDSGQYIDIKLTTYLPEGYEHGTDILKVIGTLEQADFEWLTLRALDQPYAPKRATRSAKKPLEQLMALMHEPSRATRHAAMAASPTFGWSEAQISFEVKR
jgi:hypothetical protein